MQNVNKELLALVKKIENAFLYSSKLEKEGLSYISINYPWKR